MQSINVGGGAWAGTAVVKSQKNEEQSSIQV